PAHRLDHEVVARLVRVRPAGPEAADREVDQPGVQLAERRVREAELLEATDPEVLDDDVTAAEQRAQDVPSVLPPQVEAEAALVPVDGEVVRGRPGAIHPRGDPRRAPAARRVAFRRLDLDD